MSNYPNSLKKFPVHQDVTEFVQAGHVNNLQDEVEAIEETLGTRPQIFEDAEAEIVDFYSQLTLGANDAGGLESAVSGTLTGFGLTDRAVRINRRIYGSVAERLDFIERGKPSPVFRLAASTIDLPSAGVGIDNRPSGIRFPRPTGQHDPFGMHNGIGVTLKRSGFWVFDGLAMFNMRSNTPANNYGIYSAAIDSAGDWLPGMNRVFFFDSTAGTVIVRTSWHDFFDKGSRISLRVAQNSGVTQGVLKARLSGHMVREDD